MAPNIIFLSWVFFGAIDVFLFICVLAWNIGTCWTTSHCPTKKRSQWNLKIYTAVSRFFLRTQKLVECSVVKSKTHGFYMVFTYSVCLLDWTTYRPKFGHCVFTMAGVQVWSQQQFSSRTHPTFGQNLPLEWLICLGGFLVHGWKLGFQIAWVSLLWAGCKGTSHHPTILASVAATRDLISPTLWWNHHSLYP